MATKTLISVMANIGINESPNYLRKSKPEKSNLKREELEKHNNYWQGPETSKIRRFWYEPISDWLNIPENSEQPVVEASTGDSESSIDSGYCNTPTSFFSSSSTHKMLSMWDDKVLGDQCEKLSEEHNEDQEVERENERKHNESLSSDQESSDGPAVTVSSVSLLDIIDLDIQLPNFPIEPLSLMANIKYFETSTKNVSNGTHNVGSEYGKINKLNGENFDINTKQNGKKIPSTARYLSPYITPWSIIARSNETDYSTRRSYVYMDDWNPCIYTNDG